MVNSLKLEFFFLFIFLPTLFFVIESTKMIFFVLYLVSLISFIFLKKEKNFDFEKLRKKIDWKFSLTIFVVFFIMGYFYTILLDPQVLFLFPKENFKLWLIVMILYPALSVIPQEFVYRVFFFQRYKPIFNKNFSVFLITNVFIFSYAHIVFQNIHSVIITAIVSPIFSYAYLKKSFLTCVVIHSFGGQIIFTLGLGKYFY